MLANVLVAIIRLYQLTLSRMIRAAFGPVCRFEPSCSRYAVACIQGQGALRGSLLSVKRLCKCHPFHPGGFDPPPPPRRGKAPSADALAPDIRGAVNGNQISGGEEPRRINQTHEVQPER